MRVFAVRDKAFLGKGIFALFSTMDRAEQFLDRSTGTVKQCGEVAELTVLTDGDMFTKRQFFAAYSYDALYDSHIFDGLYEDANVARDVAGNKGRVVELVIDPG